MDPLAQVLQLLHVMIALQALAMPPLIWIVHFLWKLERRVYTLELRDGIEEIPAVHLERS